MLCGVPARSCIIMGMSIQELSLKLKGFFTNTEYMLVFLIIAVAGVSFYLGRMSIGETAASPTISVQKASLFETKTAQSQGITTTSTTATTAVPIQTTGSYVASKSGTKYHFPWCPGAKQIKEENKIWFNAKADAEKAGYTPASNCKGL